jgi:hypothetical protein
MPDFMTENFADDTFLQSLVNDFPQPIMDFIESLQLLAPLPSSYLFADISQFPNESLRFFYIDENWTNALSDGALSIGRGFSDDVNFDKLTGSGVSQKARLSTYRRRFDGMNDNHKNDRVMKEYAECINRAANFTYGENAEQPMTGFIMRSELVQYLKGLEIEGKDAAGGILPLLRLDTLTDNILIGIWSGEVANFTVKEPKTALHFGYNDEGLKLKHTDTEHLGEYYTDKEPIPIPTNIHRRADIAGLAAKIANGLGITEPLTTAVFAFELMTVENIAEYTARELTLPIVSSQT